MVKQERHVEDVRHLSCSYQGEISKLSRLYKMGKGSNVVGASYSVSACAVLSTRIWV